jgi:DNA-binding NarL/FixJ family response regulator
VVRAQPRLVELEGRVRDKPVLSTSVALKLLSEFGPSGCSPAVTSYSEPLTSREQDVLRLLMQGVTTTQELSARLVVTDNTIKFHLRNILDKLQVHNRAEVIAYAGRYGLAGPPGG